VSTAATRPAGIVDPIWVPDPARAAATNLRRFGAGAAARWRTPLDTYDELHRWSVEHPDEFWRSAWDDLGVLGDPGRRVLEPTSPWWRTRFFPEGRLNVAENLLRRADASPAIEFAREDGLRRTVTWAELDATVRRAMAALRRAGVQPGDRVAAWLPNVPETVALMVATAGLGATFSSCSPDFGVRAVLDRFGQIEPSVLVAVDGYDYAGTRYDRCDAITGLVAELPTVTTAVVLDSVTDDAAARVPGAIGWRDWLDESPEPVPLERFSVDQPWYVLYSSGTTGLPKCIVHRAGGVLLKHVVEHQLHCDVRPGDRVFYFTTTGWMMWNWLASALASDATIVLYDGSPAHPAPDTLWHLADELGVTLFGTSARFLDGSAKARLAPVEDCDLGALRTIASTGSPLAPEGFAYVYERVKADVHLTSISGGTDLCGCLVAGDPSGPVYAGEIQRPGLGMDIAVYDEAGAPLGAGESGELVCRAPFPSMPLGFWADPAGERYRAAYFERFPGAWHQGDFAAWTERGGLVISGRSDATLNPGGVRIGTAEIYRQVERVDEVLDSLVIAQDWDGDTRIVLFVVLRPGSALSDALVTSIRQRIRAGASPRHVPARVVAVPDLPRTRSGKLTELAVREVVSGREPTNTEALANPEALTYFRDLAELRR
jgi:acetoacetyl-CoA synthetase